MKEILLNRGFKAIVDDSDFDNLSLYHWHVIINKTHRTQYASRSWCKNYKYYHLSMHRHILGLVTNDGLIVDHINGNGLDNRRCNLRISSPVLNQYNSRIRIDNTSKCKGVTFHKYTRKWVARIKINGQRKGLGYFDDPIDAAKAYDKAAILYRGRENTTINFPTEGL